MGASDPVASKPATCDLLKMPSASTTSVVESLRIIIDGQINFLYQKARHALQQRVISILYC